MPENKSGSNLRQVNRWQKEAARAEYLRHPDASIADVARATNVAPRTVARARAELVREGLLTPGRNNTVNGADAAALAVAAHQAGLADADVPTVGPIDPEPGTTPAAVPKGSRKGETIDGEALRQMNQMLDALADEEDNELVRKRMIRQCQRFAFDPLLHPDTRMSASQMWAKLLDMARSKDLGPGIPLTEKSAVERSRDLNRALGPKLAVAGLFAAFNTEDILNEVNTIFARGTNGDSTEQAVEQGNVPQAPDVPVGPPNDNAASPSEA